VAAVNLLLDTHVLLWWLFDDPTLDPSARASIANPENIVYVSSVSAWEVATKHRLGKLADAAGILAQELLSRGRFRELAASRGRIVIRGTGC
jgi:PIN domain nuclease of toxin-antitoxin system